MSGYKTQLVPGFHYNREVMQKPVEIEPKKVDNIDGQVIRINWTQDRVRHTTILAFINPEGQAVWNRSHMAQPEELWKQYVEDMSDEQLLAAMRYTGEFLGLGWLTYEDADPLQEKLNAEILKRASDRQQEEKTAPKPRRRKKTEPGTTPAPTITFAEAAANLKKGIHK